MIKNDQASYAFSSFPCGLINRQMIRVHLMNTARSDFSSLVAAYQVLIKVHAMHVVCRSGVRPSCPSHVCVYSTVYSTVYSLVQCIVHVCILAWCRVMSPAQPCALCCLACSKIALLQCSRQLDINKQTIKNIICHLLVRL